MSARFHPRCAVLAASLALPLSLAAQTHRVAKPEKVTRAVAVYEWTGDLNKPTASRLVPVSVFIDGHLQDAGIYLPRPVPFALQPGNIYAVEKAGDPVGTLDLDLARNITTARAAADDNPVGAWYAYGHFQPPPAAAKAPALHTTAHPGAIVASPSDGHPHMSTRSSGESSDTSKTSAGTAGASPSTSASSTAPDADTDDRPHMSRRDNSSSPAEESTPARPSSTQTTSANDDDPERPTLRRRSSEPEKKKRSKESGSGVTPLATSLNDDPDRPTLTRGSLNAPTATPELNGLPADMHQAVAVSDATTIDNHPFARAWESPAERANTLAALQQLARPRVTNYLTLNALRPGVSAPATASAAPSATPAADASEGGPPKLRRGKPVPDDAPPPPSSSKPVAHATTAAPRTTRKSSSKAAPAAPAPLLLTQEQVSGYTLSYGGLPTFVYSAVTPTAEGAPVHITLVAQQLPSGEMQVALSSVTDEAHLNRDPQLRLVDVVDPNDSHRASLLFELRGKASRQFALYSLVTAKAEQAFVTRLIE